MLDRKRNDEGDDDDDDDDEEDVHKVSNCDDTLALEWRWKRRMDTKHCSGVCGSDGDGDSDDNDAAADDDDVDDDALEDNGILDAWYTDGDGGSTGGGGSTWIHVVTTVER